MKLNLVRLHLICVFRWFGWSKGNNFWVDQTLPRTGDWASSSRKRTWRAYRSLQRSWSCKNQTFSSLAFLYILCVIVLWLTLLCNYYRAVKLKNNVLNDWHLNTTNIATMLNVAWLKRMKRSNASGKWICRLLLLFHWYWLSKS